MFLGIVEFSDTEDLPRSLILTFEPSVKLERSPLRTVIPGDLTALSKLIEALLSLEWNANDIAKGQCFASPRFPH